MAMDNPLKEGEPAQINALAAYFLVTSLIEKMMEKDILDKADVAEILEKSDSFIPNISILPTAITAELTDTFLDLRKKYGIDR